ncbi:MAG: hypothetical protein U0T81_09485 [Saprospiraceae bacterium]
MVTVFAHHFSIMIKMVDLDLFVGNHPPNRMASEAVHWNNWNKPNLEMSNHLFKNEGNDILQM